MNLNPDVVAGFIASFESKIKSNVFIRFYYEEIMPPILRKKTDKMHAFAVISEQGAFSNSHADIHQHKNSVYRFLQHVLCCILFAFVSYSSYSQNTIVYTSLDSITNIEYKKDIGMPKQYKDSAQLYASLKQWVTTQRMNYYPAFSIDSIFYSESSTRVYYFKGPRIESIQIDSLDIPPMFLTSVKRTPLNLSYKELQLLKEKILIQAENSGYPFCEIGLTAIKYNATEQVYSATLKVEKYDFIRFDSIQIDGKVRIRNRFLQSYLKMKYGTPYNEAAVKSIKKQIADLGYIEEVQPSKITFFNDKAKVYLNLRNRKTSSFDFLVGFLPNNAATGKLLITGQARLHIINPFGTGGEFHIDWQKLQPKTQRLQIHASYPYFLYLPFGFDAKFDLYKRDTSNLDINYRIGAMYNFSGNHYIKALYENRSTRMLNADSNRIKATLQLPSILDTKNALYALEYYYDNLNYKFNPQKGQVIKLFFGAGTKRIEKNTIITKLRNPINGESLESLYEKLPLRTVQFQAGFEIEKYWPIKKRSTIKTSLVSRAYIAKNIFENEMFRIGGNRILRGFDEESIFTPYFAVATAEYRFILSKNSYFYSFFDVALVEDRRYRGKKTDVPFGFGLGVSLETKIGVFGISYALGKQLDNKIDFRNSKIHFGYVAYF